MLVLFDWLYYSAITEHEPCDLGLIVWLLELMYGWSNHYVITSEILVQSLFLKTNPCHSSLCDQQNRITYTDQTPAKTTVYQSTLWVKRLQLSILSRLGKYFLN